MLLSYNCVKIVRWGGPRAASQCMMLSCLNTVLRLVQLKYLVQHWGKIWESTLADKRNAIGISAHAWPFIFD